MRRTLTVAALGLAAAATLLPVQGASASCTDLSAVGGSRCYMPCYTVLGAYERVDTLAADLLPEHVADCLE